MRNTKNNYETENAVSLRDLIVSELAAIRELISTNDSRYTERFESSQTALVAALETQKQSVVAALAAADRAVTKAEIASEKRFDSVNEFRNTLADQQRTLMPQSEVEIILRSQEEKITNITIRLDSSEAQKKGTFEGWGWAVGIVSVIITLITLAAKLFLH